MGRALILDNWRLKLFSLFVSMSLFFFVSIEGATPIDVDFPIQYRLPPDMMVDNDAPDRLSATLRGPWAAFRSYDVHDVDPVIIELTQSEPGTVRYRIEPGDVSAPAGMSVVAVRPSEVELEFDRRVEKLVPIEIDPLGRPAFGYEIAEMRVDPKRVRVSGPARRMQTLDFVYTRPVDLRDREADLTAEVELRSPPHPIRLVDRKLVQVLVDISEEIMQQRFELTVNLENAPEGTVFSPEKVGLMFKGPRRAIARLSNASDGTLVAVVDVQPEVVSGTKRFERSVSVRPELPERVQIVGVVPKVAVTLGATGSRRRRR